MTNTQLETALRKTVLDALRTFMIEHFETDALDVKNNSFCCPLVDEENNEKYALITVTIPRGKRDGNGGYVPYNGYDERDAYVDELKQTQAKKEEAKEKKENAEKLKEMKRKARGKKKKETEGDEEISAS